MGHFNFALLGQRRYLPFFIVQFFGAFNDNVVRFAMIILASYTIYRVHPEQAAQLGLIAGALFMLPYFLFSALAGQLADGMDKARLIRIIKLAELAIMCIAMLGFWQQSVAILLGALFLMGVHSAFFGPVKYAILPQHLSAHEVLGGTGLLEAGTFLAILLGQLLGSLASPHIAGLAATGFSLCGVVASRMIPSAPPLSRAAPIDKNIARSTWAVSRRVFRHRDLALAVLGISWFFAIGLVMQTQFAPLVSGVFHAGQNVVTVLLLVNTVGIALGSITIAAVLKGEITDRYVPLSAHLMALGCLGLYYATSHFTARPGKIDIAGFLQSSGALPVLASLGLLAFSSGMFVVPLYAILQTRSAPGACAQGIAANNIANALFMVGLSLSAAALLHFGLSVPQLIGVLGVATATLTLFAFGFRLRTAGT